MANAAKNDLLTVHCWDNGNKNFREKGYMSKI
jgi:hypothetical protein